MKAICFSVRLVAVFPLLIVPTQSGLATNFFLPVVPNASSNVDGNTYSVVGPGVNQPLTRRFQQVYGAPEFAYLTNFGGGWVYSVLFRGDVTNGAGFGIYMPSVQVNLSTTTRGPDELSTTFAENIGTNETRISEGQLVTMITAGERTEAPEPFEFKIPIMGPMFFYDPARGNLLLDVRIFQGNTNTLLGVAQYFDAVNATNDSVSRVYSDVFASTGVADTVGLPTMFYCFANPKPSIRRSTNTLVIEWPTPFNLPLRTSLQTTTNILQNSTWTLVTNGVVNSNFVSSYSVPLGSNRAAAYFRLLSSSP